jgi:hypothetical protein
MVILPGIVWAEAQVASFSPAIECSITKDRMSGCAVAAFAVVQLSRESAKARTSSAEAGTGVDVGAWA